jgi:elongation factor G
VPLQLPIGAGDAFDGIVDLVRMKAWRYITLEEREEIPIPDSMQEAVAAGRRAFVEAAAERDESLLERYAAGEEIPTAEIVAVLRRAVIANDFQPVLCGAALRNKGIHRLLDAVVALLPSPLDLPPVRGADDAGAPVTRACDPRGPLAALAFKTIHDRTGDLTFLRIYSGTLHRGDGVWNARRSCAERVGRLCVMKADDRLPVEEATAGQIVAAIGLKDTVTGDTLCPKDARILLEAMQFPQAVISMAIVPKKRADRDKLGEALQALGREDPTFRHYVDEETGDTIIAGMGELHLEIVSSRLRGEFKLEVDVGAPRVAYRQRLRRACDVEGRHIKQTGGSGQYGVVNVRFDRAETDDLEYVDAVTGGSVPREYIPAVRKGIEAAMARGGEAGFPFVQVKAELYDGKAHAVDSSDLAFQQAGRLAFEGAVQRAGITLLEPIMRVTVQTPSANLGDVIGSLNARRAEIESISEGRGDFSQVQGRVPLAEMFQYATLLRSLTSGRGTYTMEPALYAPVPEAMAEEILREAKARRQQR